LRPACSCQVETYEQELRDREEQRKAQWQEQLFSNSGLGPRFSRCTLENWRKRPGTAKAYTAAREYAGKLEENLRAGEGLLLIGEPGNGKSHLLAAIANTALDRGHAVVFQRVPHLLASIRATYNGGVVTEQQIMSTLTRADLLVLDDAGSEKWTEWTEPTLYTIIDERYTRQKALLVSTNATFVELEQKIGPRTMDRLLEMCIVAENKGSSCRKKRHEPPTTEPATAATPAAPAAPVAPAAPS